jgi:hypothetical protein
MDGTYNFFPKFFKKLYTIHGFQNGHYVPLVFILLSGDHLVAVVPHADLVKHVGLSWMIFG